MMHTSKYIKKETKNLRMMKCRVAPFYKLFMILKKEFGTAEKAIKYIGINNKNMEAELRRGNLTPPNARKILKAYNSIN